MSIKSLLLRAALQALRERGFGRQYGYARGKRKTRGKRGLKGRVLDFLARRLEKKLLKSRRW